MAHYAKIVNNLVTEVIVADPEFISTLGGQWIETSYNTHGGIHYGDDGKPDGGIALRKNYARIGMVYYKALDAFIERKPFPSWSLNEGTGMWEPPVPQPQVPQPTDLTAPRIQYYWDEPTRTWIAKTMSNPSSVPATSTIPTTVI